MHVDTLGLDTAAPEDLGGRLHADTGLTPAEMQRQLASPCCIASTVAAALLPFLGEDAPTRADLAGKIADAGTDAVRREVCALYASTLESSAVTAAAGQGGGESAEDEETPNGEDAD